MTEEHKHKFRTTIHMDGCHFFTYSYACVCGAGLFIYTERDFKGDSYSYMWSENGGCDRCLELEGGARRMPYQMFIQEPGKATRRIWRPELKLITC